MDMITPQARLLAAMSLAFTLVLAVGCEDKAQTPPAQVDANSVEGADLGAAPAEPDPTEDKADDPVMDAIAQAPEAESSAKDVADDAGTPSVEEIAAAKRAAAAALEYDSPLATPDAKEALVEAATKSASRRPDKYNQEADKKDARAMADASIAAANQLSPEEAAAMARPEDMPALRTPTMEGYNSISFDTLTGFDYFPDDNVPDGSIVETAADVPDPSPEGDAGSEGADKDQSTPEDAIPEEVLALDGTKIAVAGFMIPIDFKQGKTNEFILSKVIPSCFFCTPPMVNDWIEVKTVEGKRVDYVGDEPLVVFGTLSVGAVKEDGFTVSFYRLAADGTIPFKTDEP